MIVDTSALIALIQDEPDAHRVAVALAGVKEPTVAAPSAVETLIVLTARQGPVARTVFERLRAEINLGIAQFTQHHVAAAQRAYRRWGEGRHPAGLNYGDCMSYAVAEVSGEPLLAVGDDFPHTDLEFGDGIVGYWPTSGRPATKRR